MNHGAHVILGEVISKQGVQLAISNAYCKVYLAGNMKDYPDEKRQLVALKTVELPKALLDFKSGLISGADLCSFIQKMDFRHADRYSVAWGVDAWAAALNVSEEMRRNIRKQCYPSIIQQLNSDRYSTPSVETNVAINPETIRSTPKTRSAFGVFLLTSVSVAGLIMLTVLGKPLLDSLASMTSSVSEAWEVPTRATQKVLEDDIDIITTRLLTSSFHLASDSRVIMDAPAVHSHHTSPASHQSIGTDDFSTHQSISPKEYKPARAQLIDFEPQVAQENTNKEVTLEIALLDETVVNDVVERKKKVPLLKYSPKLEQLNADIEAFLRSGNSSK